MTGPLTLVTLLEEVQRHLNDAAEDLARCKWWTVWRWPELFRARRALERAAAARECFLAIEAISAAELAPELLPEPILESIRGVVVRIYYGESGRVEIQPDRADHGLELGRPVWMARERNPTAASS